MNSILESRAMQDPKAEKIFSFSILVCTYNPEQQIFHRVLSSIASLIVPEGIQVECIIVDNNSSTPIDSLHYVQEFLHDCPWAKVIQEPKQGLTFARISGVQTSESPFVIFIDDDNEVLPSYLTALIDLFSNYPSVGAWGPGNVTVEFLGIVSSWFSKNFQSIFQENHIKCLQYGYVPEAWTSFYPIGTGLAVRREVLEKYCTAIESGSLRSSDRKGKALSSGGDIQIVWEAIKMGYSAGICPTLAVNHLIPSNRSNLDYVKRLKFGTESSYLPCLASSFPETIPSIAASTPTSSSILVRLLREVITHTIKLKWNLLVPDLAKYIGSVSGHYQVLEESNPIADFMIKQLKLK
jgi:glycosyltransferase involved in cell wall biosynthesis